jgi:hypothetical protein
MMSKKSSGRVSSDELRTPKSGKAFPVILFFILAVSVIAVVRTSAQRSAQGSDTSTLAARNAALAAATNEVLQETSQLRELAVLRPVQSSAQSRAEIERMIIGNLDRETTPAEMHASEVTLKKLGLAPADFQLRPLIVRLLTEQVAGYYDPKVQQFHLADWIDIDGQKPIMAHELTHALQDQHFNLRRFEQWPKGDSDAELAAHALIEGDATLAMTMYVTSNPLRALAFIKSLTGTEAATEELDKAPRALRETLLFPYQEGLNWTRVVYQSGGWSKVSQAFTTLPQSTEQILHPEKYFAREAPVRISLPDIRLSLGRGWRQIDSDVNGEWSFYLILDQFLKSAATSRQAAAGWAGDRYAVHENARGQSVYISLSAWDTEKDAREFFDAYIKRSKLRYSNARVISDEPARWLARTSEGDVSVEIRGKRVLVFEGLLQTANRAALRKLWS